MLRLLKSTDSKSVAHLLYWIGDSLDELLPGAGTVSHPENVPDYFAYLESLVIFRRMEDILNVQTWKSLTNKALYVRNIDSLPTPKVEVEAQFSYKNVWRLLNLPVLYSSTRDIFYLLIHNKLPVRERLHRAGIVNDPYCRVCSYSQVADIEHYFCSCVRINNVWRSIKQKIVQLAGHNITNFALINLTFPKCSREKEMVWLLGHYVAIVWEEIHVKGGDHLQWNKFFGFLQFKYKADQQGARQKLNPIPDLL